jgi:hypothetical protein
MGIPLVVAETSVTLFYGQGLAVAWMAGAGVMMLLRR